MNIKKYIGILALTAILVSCSEDFLEPELSTDKDLSSGLNTAEDLQGVMYGILNFMTQPELYGRDAVILGEVRTDNAISNQSSGRFITEGRFLYTTEGATAINLWDAAYEAISAANLVINTEVEDNESALVQHIKGQAYALRAMNYTTLLTNYGQMHTGGNLGVPIVTEFVDSSNPGQPSRATIDDTWAFIKSDLETAFQLMSEDLNAGNSTPSTYMAKALESRVDLYTGDWAGAIEAAEYVINSGVFDLLSGQSYVNSWWIDGQDNVIFELGQNATDNTNINGLYQITRPTTYGDVIGTADLYSIYNPGDIRLELYDQPAGEVRTKKYGTFTSTGEELEDMFDNNIELITYAEVILNYAEALARTNNPDALVYLNMLATERNVGPYAVASVDNILLERRRELAFQGLRFYDLMRTGQDIPARGLFSDAIPYGDYRLALPIPRAELDANPNIEQNREYAD